MLYTSDRECLGIRHCPKYGWKLKLIDKNILHRIHDPCCFHNYKSIQFFLLKLPAYIDGICGIPCHLFCINHRYVFLLQCGSYTVYQRLCTLPAALKLTGDANNSNSWLSHIHPFHFLMSLLFPFSLCFFHL